MYIIISLTTCSGISRQNVDWVRSQKNLAKNEIFVHFHSNLELFTGFQKLCDPAWIRHCICSVHYAWGVLSLTGGSHRGCLKSQHKVGPTRSV